MKDGLGGKIVAKFVALRPKTYGYLTDDRDEKQKLKLRDYKNCIRANSRK